MKKFILVAAAATTLAACGGVNVPTTSAPGLNPKSKISILFQDFEEGTICSVKLPSGTLQTVAMPGRIEYPAANRQAPVSCRTPRRRSL